jgi:hypothetical protein
MNYSTQDTSWAISAKGHHWRRLDGKVLAVGGNSGPDNSSHNKSSGSDDVH